MQLAILQDEKMTAQQIENLKYALAKVPSELLIAELHQRGELVKSRLRKAGCYCAACQKQATWHGCEQCREIIRTYQRNKYRARKRIPLDAPRYNVTP